MCILLERNFLDKLFIFFSFPPTPDHLTTLAYSEGFSADDELYCREVFDVVVIVLNKYLNFNSKSVLF